MNDYSQYFLMIRESDPASTSRDVIPYILLKTSDEISWDKSSIRAEIPAAHGNLNHVCRISDAKGNKVFLKQAGDTLRISEDMTATLDRNRQEAEILLLEEKLAPGMVPHVYCYDTTMSALIMEDCSDYLVMRDAMLKHLTYPLFAEQIADFLVKTLLYSSDVVLDHREKKRLTGQFLTPDLCDITEKLVLMEPYLGADRNNVFPANRDFVKKELYSDKALHLAVSKLKFAFMTNAQALLHGDLHTGSIFIKDNGRIKVFDSEFGTFAPMGYDIGNVLANLIFAYCNGLSCGDEGFCVWALNMVRQTLDLFIAGFTAQFDQAATEPMAKVNGFKEWYLDQILLDTAGFTGTELHRRTVGMANVADLTSIADARNRTAAERICILAGKRFILDPASFKTGKDYASAVMEISKAIL